MSRAKRNEMHCKKGSDHWMQDTKNPKTTGSLRRTLHKKKGEKISHAEIERAENSRSALTRKRAQLAERFEEARNRRK